MSKTEQKNVHVRLNQKDARPSQKACKMELRLTSTMLIRRVRGCVRKCARNDRVRCTGMSQKACRMEVQPTCRRREQKWSIWRGNTYRADVFGVLIKESQK
jgi:hypothetical protein